MAFVGAYVDKEGKTQLVSSNPFKTVMMPLPEEGLSPWIYPHASFLIQEKKRRRKERSILKNATEPSMYHWTAWYSRPRTIRTAGSIPPKT